MKIIYPIDFININERHKKSAFKQLEISWFLVSNLHNYIANKLAPNLLKIIIIIFPHVHKINKKFIFKYQFL